MSTRELAYSIIDRFTEKQVEDFVLMYRNSVPEEDIPNEETRKVLDDVRSNRNVSRNFTSVKELMEDLNADD